MLSRSLFRRAVLYGRFTVYPFGTGVPSGPLRGIPRLSVMAAIIPHMVPADQRNNRLMNKMAR